MSASSESQHPPYADAAQQHIEALPACSQDFDDDDSAFGSEIGTDVSSLTSKIFNYEYENGRRYHSFRTYVLPNDEIEQNRLDIWHHVELLILKGELTYVQLDNPKRILDVGTGTGNWAIDASEKWPSASITAVDISKIQLPSWAPPNCAFEEDDVELDWVFTTGQSFDLVHVRYMLGSIKDWDKLFEQAYRFTTPGGYVEVKEAVLEMYSQLGSEYVPETINEYFSMLLDAAEQSGCSMRGAENLADKLRAAGYVDIRVHVEHLPVASWPKERTFAEIGAYTQMAHMEGFKSYGMALFTRVLGMDPEQAKAVFAKAESEIGNKKLQLYTLRYGVTARRPGEDG